jgi:hypothetical protein
VWIGLTMMTSIKVRKLFQKIKIFTYHRVWLGKRWETFFWTCVPLSKALIVRVSWSVSWAIIHSLPQKHQNKWVFKSSMVWPY